MQGESRSQVYLDYAEPRGVEAHEVWLTAADFAETRNVCELIKIVSLRKQTHYFALWDFYQLSL